MISQEEIVQATRKTDITLVCNMLDTLSFIKRDREKAIEGSGLQMTRDFIDAEITRMCADSDAAIKELEKVIKAHILELGETAKGAELMAVYNKGRRTWDTKWLLAYAEDHPEVKSALKQGKPYVSIKGRK